MTTLRNGNRIFITDCEGPISKNDNAFELASHFIPNGAEFFTLLSRYDDVLADVVKKPGYKAGDTLKLILPFLKAYGATDAKIREFSSKNIVLIPGAAEMLRYVNEQMPSFIVSTSYEHYISPLCSLIRFPYENTYCTKLNLDQFELTDEEVKALMRLREEMATYPMIELPEHPNSLQDFSPRDQRTISRLDTIFWDEISRMAAGDMLRDINPVGGHEKAKAVRQIVEKLDAELCDVVYVGDSITDAPPLRLVREGKGLAISFNGNDYAIREADIAVISNNAMIIAPIAYCFSRFGKETTIKMVKELNLGLERYCAGDLQLCRRVRELFPDQLPTVEVIEESDKDRLTEKSKRFRKIVRGEKIGSLG
ncbi:MAG: hypothetical protein QXJ75_05040 [Candidatus Bathyarchaeia archaeon]